MVVFQVNAPGDELPLAGHGDARHSGTEQSIVSQDSVLFPENDNNLNRVARSSQNNPHLGQSEYLGHASPSFFPYTHGGEYDIELDHFLDPETISDFLSTELSQTRGQGLSNSPGTADNQYVSQSNHEVPSFPFSDSHGAAGCSNNELQELEEAETSRDNRGNRRDEDQVKASGGYKSRRQSRTHNRTHHCTEPGCGANFAEEKDLRRHFRTKHVEDRPYKCRSDQCKYSKLGFKRKDNLVRHERTAHTDALP